MLEFLITFLAVLAYIAPVWLSLLALIFLLGWAIGRLEGWSLLNSTYFAFVAATTVGFGDFAPRKPLSKLLAIVIALIGILATGVLVACCLHALEVSMA